jgi:Protein of unknown function (DUF1838)
MKKSINPQAEITRRHTFGLLAGLGASSVVGPALAANADARVAITSPQDRMRTFMLMRGALDDRLVMHWLQGRYYGLVEGEVTLLFGLLSAQFSRFRPDGEGGYYNVRAEASFITNTDTGEAISEIRNPYTSAMMTAPARNYPPSSPHIRADLSFDIVQQPGAKLLHEVQGIVTNGGDVWISEISTAKTPVPNSRPSLYNEMLTYHARSGDLQRRGAKRVPCDISITNTVSWRSWMNMGDHPGHLLVVGAGQYVDSIDELPPAWMRAARAAKLPLADDPLAVLAPVWDKLPVPRR